MNAFDSHPIYKKYNVCWNEDYILGLVAFDEGLTTLMLVVVVSHSTPHYK
jgi:hypothetical protein